MKLFVYMYVCMWVHVCVRYTCICVHGQVCGGQRSTWVYSSGAMQLEFLGRVSRWSISLNELASEAEELLFSTS